MRKHNSGNLKSSNVTFSCFKNHNSIETKFLPYFSKQMGTTANTNNRQWVPNDAIDSTF